MVIITFNANRERTSSLVIYWKVLCGKASTYVIVPLIHLIIDHHLHILEHKTQPTSTNPIHQSWLFGELHLMIWFWIRNISVWAVIECDDWRNNHSFFLHLMSWKFFGGFSFNYRELSWLKDAEMRWWIAVYRNSMVLNQCRDSTDMSLPFLLFRFT